jgi:hypothetical protein
MTNEDNSNNGSAIPPPKDDVPKD